MVSGILARRKGTPAASPPTSTPAVHRAAPSSTARVFSHCIAPTMSCYRPTINTSQFLSQLACQELPDPIPLRQLQDGGAGGHILDRQAHRLEEGDPGGNAFGTGGGDDI